MYRETGIILTMIVIARLIVLKFDQQFVILLRGKLFKQERDIDAAATVYKKHKNMLSVIFFMLGGAAIGVSMILLANGQSLFPLSVAITMMLLGAGIWGRISSFRAADRELGEAASAHRDQPGL